MSARDLFAESQAKAAPAVEQTCGGCANSILWRNGFVKCGLRPQFELLPLKRGCHFEVSRWVDDPLRREAITIIDICSLEARRMYLARADAERGKAEALKLREMVKRVWKERKAVEAVEVKAE